MRSQRPSYVVICQLLVWRYPLIHCQPSLKIFVLHSAGLHHRYCEAFTLSLSLSELWLLYNLLLHDRWLVSPASLLSLVCFCDVYISLHYVQHFQCPKEQTRSTLARNYIVLATEVISRQACRRIDLHGAKF